MSNYFDPNDNDRFRRATARGTGSLGVIARRYCSVCGKYKALTAGHKRYPAFMCTECVDTKKAATLEKEELK